MTSAVHLRCRQRSCAADSGGPCLEGYARPADCPHAGPQPGAAAAGAEHGSDHESGWVELPEGADLDASAAERLTRAAPTRVIVLAGPADSGKTTLLASIYESFQHGPFAGCLFAGSDTLLGLERRCHLGRIESGRAIPDTARTLSTGAPRWLHLRVRVEDSDAPPRNLLVSEVPGDLFRLAKDSSDECRRLTASRRADHFVVLVDGAKLVQRQHRLTSANDAALFLRSCLDADMLGRSSFVDMILTKWDLVGRAADAPEIEQSLAAFVERTRQHCEARLGRLRFLRVAARPVAGSGLPFAHGLAEAFGSWVTDSPAFARPAPTTVPIADTGSEFDRYLWRQLPALRPGGPGGNGAGV